MSKKKKKPSRHQLQKLSAAQYKNEFFRKFRYFFNAFCDKNLFWQIPPVVLEDLYSLRSRYIQLVATKGKYLSNATLERFKKDLTMLHKKDKFKLANTDVEISVYDFLTVGFSLKILELLIDEDDFPAAKEIKNSLSKFDILEEFRLKIDKKIWVAFQAIAFWKNDISKCQYWFRYKYETVNELEKGNYHSVYVQTVLPEKSSVTINGNTRPAILFEWVKQQEGPKCVSIKPSSLNIEGPFNSIPMKVYIQNHALQRLAERIDCISPGFAQFYMYHSFIDIRVFYDHHNNLLVEYRIDGIRAGYFRVDIIDGTVIIRTFLFITNNGTPEGQLLEKNTGLQKLDKKYLAMDKLSSFMTSDIGDNNDLRKIIDKAGCHCLIELYENLEGIITKEGNYISENLLVNYLHKDKLVETDNNLF